MRATSVPYEEKEEEKGGIKLFITFRLAKRKWFVRSSWEKKGFF